MWANVKGLCSNQFSLSGERLQQNLLHKPHSEALISKKQKNNRRIWTTQDHIQSMVSKLPLKNEWVYLLLEIFFFFFFSPRKKHPSSFPVFFFSTFLVSESIFCPCLAAGEPSFLWMWRKMMREGVGELDKKKNGFPLNNARLGLGSDQCAISYRKETTVNTSPTLLVDSAHVKCQANQSLSLRRSLAVSFFGINKTWQRWLHCPLVPSLCFSVSWVFFTHTMFKTEAVGKIAYKAAAPTLSHNEWEPVKFHSPWIDKKFCDIKKKNHNKKRCALF